MISSKCSIKPSNNGDSSDTKSSESKSEDKKSLSSTSMEMGFAPEGNRPVASQNEKYPKFTTTFLDEENYLLHPNYVKQRVPTATNPETSSSNDYTVYNTNMSGVLIAFKKKLKKKSNMKKCIVCTPSNPHEKQFGANKSVLNVPIVEQSQDLYYHWLQGRITELESRLYELELITNNKMNEKNNQKYTQKENSTQYSKTAFVKPTVTNEQYVIVGNPKCLNDAAKSVARNLSEQNLNQYSVIYNRRNEVLKKDKFTKQDNRILTVKKEKTPTIGDTVRNTRVKPKSDVCTVTTKPINVTSKDIRPKNSPLGVGSRGEGRTKPLKTPKNERVEKVDSNIQSPDTSSLKGEEPIRLKAVPQRKAMVVTKCTQTDCGTNSKTSDDDAPNRCTDLRRIKSCVKNELTDTYFTSEMTNINESKSLSTSNVSNFIGQDATVNTESNTNLKTDASTATINANTANTECNTDDMIDNIDNINTIEQTETEFIEGIYQSDSTQYVSGAEDNEESPNIPNIPVMPTKSCKSLSSATLRKMTKQYQVTTKILSIPPASPLIKPDIRKVTFGDQPNTHLRNISPPPSGDSNKKANPLEEFTSLVQQAPFVPQYREMKNALQESLENALSHTNARVINIPSEKKSILRSKEGKRFDTKAKISEEEIEEIDEDEQEKRCNSPSSGDCDYRYTQKARSESPKREHTSSSEESRSKSSDSREKKENNADKNDKSAVEYAKPKYVPGNEERKTLTITTQVHETKSWKKHGHHINKSMEQQHNTAKANKKKAGTKIPVLRSLRTLKKDRIQLVPVGVSPKYSSFLIKTESGKLVENKWLARFAAESEMEPKSRENYNSSGLPGPSK